MLEKAEFETILHIHGANVNSPKETIRTILLSAECSEEEINHAFLLFAEKRDLGGARNNGLYKIFRTDNSLRPAEISALLGVDMKISEAPKKFKKVREASLKQTVIIFGMTILLAMFGLVFAMYFNEIGPFHQSVSFSLLK